MTEKINNNEFVQTPHGVAYSNENPQWGDKLEIATRIQDLDDRIKEIQNSWYRADETSKEHKAQYSETLDNVIRLAAFASGLGADLHVYVLDKVQKWEKEDASE
jgi:hypothetical protein